MEGHQRRHPSRHHQSKADRIREVVACQELARQDHPKAHVAFLSPHRFIGRDEFFDRYQDKSARIAPGYRMDWMVSRRRQYNHAALEDTALDVVAAQE